MKKIIAILMLMILLLSSVSIVFAESDIDTENNNENTGENNIELYDSNEESNEMLSGEEIINSIDEIENIESFEDIKEISVETESEQKTCMEKLKEKFPNRRLNVLRSKCVIRKKVAVNVGILKNIRTEQTERLNNALESCKTDACKERVQERIQNVAKLSDLKVQRLKNIAERKVERLKEIVKSRNTEEFRKFASDKAFKAREIAKERIQTARQNFKKAQERYSAAKERFETAREKVKDIKERKSYCADEETSDECKLVKSDTIEFLSNSADVILENLEKVKAKIEESEDLSEEEAEDMLSNINSQITKVESIRSKISDLSDETPKADINEVAKELRDAWREIARRIKINSGRMINARIGKIIVQSDILQGRLELTLERLEEQGIDTTDIEASIDEMNAQLETAREKYRVAVQKYKSADVPGEVDEAVKDAKEAMEEAKNALREAHANIKDILAKLRAENAEDTLEEITNEDVTAELEEAEA